MEHDVLKIIMNRKDFFFLGFKSRQILALKFDTKDVNHKGRLMK